jgi:hypothetical protein
MMIDMLILDISQQPQYNFIKLSIYIRYQQKIAAKVAIKSFLYNYVSIIPFFYLSYCSSSKLLYAIVY